MKIFIRTILFVAFAFFFFNVSQLEATKIFPSLSQPTPASAHR